MENPEHLLKRIATLEHKLDVLMEHRLGMLEDIEAINRLQHMYGYYTDMCLWEQMTDLFADRGAALEIGRRGRYVGKENILRFLRDVNGGGGSGLKRQEVVNHMQSQGVVTVATDRSTAQGRWRALIQVGGGVQRQSTPGAAATAETPDSPGTLRGGAMMYSEGIYENTYVREAGVWKIAVLFWVPTYYVSHTYDRMWFESGAVSTTIPPQAAPTPPLAALGRQFMPYHYVHPITGQPVTRVSAQE